MISYQSDSGRVWVGGRARVLDEGGSGVKAWAEKHVRRDPDLKWMLGNYVEADNANSNGHIFPLADLTDYGVATIANKPLNMLHHGRYIIGSLVAAEMIAPTPQANNDAGSIASLAPHPVVEVLSGMWPGFFPDEAALVTRAHQEGSLFYSMECLPTTVTCPIEGCATTAAWEGFQSEQYCDHMNASRISAKRLNRPHFNAGAAIIPPVQPGWSHADITDLSALLKQHAEKAEALYADVETETPHLGPTEWERIMVEIVGMAEGANVG